MKIGLLGFKETRLLKTLQVILNDTDHEAETFILSDIPGSMIYKVTHDNLILNESDLLDFDIFYLANYRFFWGHQQFLSNSFNHWKKMPQDFISEDIVNFRESESVRASILFILNQLNKLINPIEFFLLFEYKLWLLKLLEEYDLPIIDYHIETKISEKLDLAFEQDFLSYSGYQAMSSFEEYISIGELNKKKIPRLMKKNHTQEKFDAYLCGQQILFAEEDSELNRQCIPFLERVRNTLLEILNDWKFFCRIEFTYQDGIFLIEDIEPSPDIKDQIYLKKLIELIIKGGE